MKGGVRSARRVVGRRRDFSRLAGAASVGDRFSLRKCIIHSRQPLSSAGFPQTPPAPLLPPVIFAVAIRFFVEVV